MMCETQQGFVSEMEGDINMTSVGNHGGGSPLYPNQFFVKIKPAGENVLSGLRALFQFLHSICFGRELLFLYSMALMLIHAHGEEQTGICKLMDSAIIWDISSLVPDTEATNICIPHGHRNAEKHSPDPLGPRIPFRNIEIMVVVTVLAIGLAGWMLYKRRQAFTEADIDMGLRREPAVPRQSDSTFEILPSID